MTTRYQRATRARTHINHVAPQRAHVAAHARDELIVRHRPRVVGVEVAHHLANLKT